MAAVVDRRMTAEIKGDVVVFLIGMRINRFRRVSKWVPSPSSRCRACCASSNGLPKRDCLGPRFYFGSPRRPLIIQYWRSVEHLEAYARSRNASPLASLGRIQQADWFER